MTMVLTLIAGGYARQTFRSLADAVAGASRHAAASAPANVQVFMKFQA